MGRRWWLDEDTGPCKYARIRSFFYTRTHTHAQTQNTSPRYFFSSCPTADAAQVPFVRVGNKCIYQWLMIKYKCTDAGELGNVV